MDHAINIGLMGLGTVGAGVVKVLRSNADAIEKRVGCPIRVKSILVRDAAKSRDVATEATITSDVNLLLDDPEIDIIVEVMGGIQPAKEYILRALQAGKHVVTANKDLVAEQGRDLFAAAEENQRDFLFEASVGGGIPIIRPLKQCLAANNIHEILGIVNGTTNYMLTRMTQEGLDFDDVLAQAQANGYAEANPSADVDGWDAARKIAILASIAFNTRVHLEDVYVEGIRRVSAEDIEYARELGYVIKLLAIAREDNRGVNVRVHPAFISTSHPLANVQDVYNAVFVQGDAVGETMFYGRGAGEMPTASAVVADVIDVARDIRHHVSSRILCTCFEEKPVYPMQLTESAYYIRLLVEDRPGAFAAIAGAFGAQQVSLHSVIQKRKIGACAEVVLVTYRVSDSALRLAIQTLEGMSVVNRVGNVIRVEEKDA